MKPQRPALTLRMVSTAFIIGLVTTGCSSDQDSGYNATPPSQAPTVSATPQDEPSPSQQEPSTQPVGEFSTARYESETWPEYGQTQGIYPVAMRSATHDGFERIVIEHAGTGTPSMLVQYTDDPVAPGSGEPLDLDQNTALEIIWSGTASIDDVDVDQLMQVNDPITDLDTTAAQSVVVFAPWEATSSYFIGLDEQRPYAVTILEDPVRLVVDIQTD